MVDPRVEELVEEADLTVSDRETPLKELDRYGEGDFDSVDTGDYELRPYDGRATPCSPSDIDALNRMEDRYGTGGFR